MKIIKLITKNNQEIELGKISILVGANNVGKSQTLIDIKNRMIIGLASKPVIIKKIFFEKPDNFDKLFDGLTIKDHATSVEHNIVVGINSQLSDAENIQIHKDSLKNQFNNKSNLDFLLGNVSRLRLSFLDASSRLSLARTVNSINPHEDTPSHLLHKLLQDELTEKELASAFKMAFQMAIKFDDSGYKDFCLRVSKQFRKIPVKTRDAYPVFNKYNKLDNQGDGFKSFVGIVLSILFSKDRIILLDEPEAFLHPAQAKFLGKWIADQSINISGQLMISTHNAAFLSGILSSNQEVNIYRVNREDNNTEYHLLPPSAIEVLTKSPMLSSQRVMESIFHKGVVVCEADADRSIYESVAQKELNNQSILFIHSHNKQTLKDVINLLVTAKIPVGAIADIDLLNDERNLILTIEALTGKKTRKDLIRKRKEIESSVQDQSDNEILKKIKKSLEQLIKELGKKEHSLDGLRGALNRIRKETTKWAPQKKLGLNSFNPEMRKKVTNFLKSLNRIRLFIVPVGELENWIDVGVSKKNRWIIPALSVIHSGSCPNNLKIFIKTVLDKMEENVS